MAKPPPSPSQKRRRVEAARPKLSTAPQPSQPQGRFVFGFSETTCVSPNRTCFWQCPLVGTVAVVRADRRQGQTTFPVAERTRPRPRRSHGPVASRCCQCSGCCSSKRSTIGAGVPVAIWLADPVRVPQPEEPVPVTAAIPARVKVAKRENSTSDSERRFPIPADRSRRRRIPLREKGD